MSPNLPHEMRIIHMNEPGGAEVLFESTAPIPSPATDEVLIRVVAAGVNRPDIIQRQGSYPPPAGASPVLGLEIAGTVVRTAQSGQGPAVGDEVVALVSGGGYAEYCTAPAVQCLSVPKGLSVIEAAGIPETFFTVWNNVYDRCGLKPTECFLVHGGTSGIGTTAIQLAHAFGSEVYTTAGSDEKCAVCQDLGATLAINYKTDDFVAVLKEQVKGGVNVILDMVGGPYLARNIKVLAAEGRLCNIAYLQGSKTEVDFMMVMLKRLTITGSTLRAMPVPYKAALAEKLHRHVWPLLEAGTVRPVIYKTLPLSQASQAHALMESSQHVGKIILEVGA